MTTPSPAAPTGTPAPAGPPAPATGPPEPPPPPPAPLPGWIPAGARRLSPRIVIAWDVGAGVLAGFLGLGAAIPAWVGWSASAAAVVAGATLVGSLAALVPFNRARHRRWWYVFGEAELIVGRGVFFRRRTCVPRARIQHIDLESGPLGRRLGLQSVEVYTAGTQQATVGIPGVPGAEAEALRAWVLDGRSP